MSISVLRRPYERNWSGNPIHYTLYSAAAEADATIFFEIRIKFKRTDEAAYSTVISLPYQPVEGTAKIDIQDILDGKLEYELPYLPVDDEFASPYAAKKMTGLFYIEFREITEADPDPAWDDSEDANELFVAKGGISFHKWRGDNYWVNYFDQLKPFLGWEKSGTEHSLTERMYLAWLNLTDEYEGDIKMLRTVRYTDGSEDVEELNCPVSKYNVCYFPSGGAQLEIEAIDPTKTIYWWELQVIKVSTNPNEPLSEAFRYYADNRQDYNAITLNYRNSLGGIGSARVRGVIDYTLNRSFTETEKVVLHNYFEEHFVNGRIGADNGSEIQVLKGDLGHLGKEQQDRLRDINFRREVWWEQQLKWLPVMILTPSNRLRLSTDKLFSMPIEFCIAAGDEYYYTPEGVNLADEAEETPGLICTAIINTLTSNYIPGTGWVIGWTLVSGTPNRYFISTPGVSGGAPGESISTNYTFPWLPVGDNVITVQPLCLIGGVYYLGAAQTITVTVTATCVNVTINSSPVYLPNAIDGVPYNYVINLNGTSPFVVGSITKPAWMSITVVGSTIEITGTPGPGDVGTDISVGFTVTNCSIGSVEYSDTIDVSSFSGNGDFILINEVASGMNFIKNVFPNPPAFYTISTGAIPVLAAQTTTGLMTSAVAGPVSVFVIVSTITCYIELYKNGVLQETVYTPASGTYSFATVAFSSSDDMTIKLKNI